MNGQESIDRLDLERFARLPGLFRRWEIAQVLTPNTDFHIEDAGTAADGTQLFAVYRWEPEPDEDPLQHIRAAR